jgi:hypothetical protein
LISLIVETQLEGLSTGTGSDFHLVGTPPDALAGFGWTVTTLTGEGYLPKLFYERGETGAVCRTFALADFKTARRRRRPSAWGKGHSQ